MKLTIPIAALLALLLTGDVNFSIAGAQGTAFTYQGRLNQNGSPGYGSYDLRFTLFATNVAGAALAGPVTNPAVAVTNGLFTTTVDFGAVFTGGSNWLELAVSTNAANAFTALTPRQPLTPVPYAITAANVSGAISLAQLPANLLTNGARGVNISGTFTGNGFSLTNLNAAQLTGIVSPSDLPSDVVTNRPYQVITTNISFTTNGLPVKISLFNGPDAFSSGTYTLSATLADGAFWTNSANTNAVLQFSISGGNDWQINSNGLADVYDTEGGGDYQYMSLGNWLNELTQDSIPLMYGISNAIPITNNTTLLSAPYISGSATLLTNFPVSVVTNDANVNAYLARNNIISPVAQTAVCGQVNSAKTFGIYSNLVALVNLRPEFNPATGLDFFGRPYAVVNPQWTAGGLLCTLTNGFAMGGFGLTNYTLVVTLSRQAFAQTSIGGGFGFAANLVPAFKSLFFSFENTNTGSGQFVDYGDTWDSYGLNVVQKNGGVWPCGTNVNNLPVSAMLGPLGGYQTIYTLPKRVYCLSCFNHSNFLWIDTLPVYQNSAQQIASLVVCTDLLQQITFGVSTNYTQDLWNGDPRFHTNSTEVVESVMLFNVGAVPYPRNLVYGSYQMAQWPDWNLPYQVMFGDSIVCPLSHDRAGFAQSYTNDFFYNLNSFTPDNPNWMNLAQSGSTLASCLTNFWLGVPWPLTPVSLLPQITMGVPVTIWNDEGRNDQPQTSPANEAIYSAWLTQFAAPYKQLGGYVFWNQIETEPLALYSIGNPDLASTLQYNANLVRWNLTARSNPVVNRSFSFAQAMNTNNLAIGHGLSADGVHPYTNNAAYLALAKWALGIQTDMITPAYSGDFTGNGSGLTGLNAAQLTGTVSTAILPGITTNVSAGGITLYITNGLIMRVSAP